MCDLRPKLVPVEVPWLISPSTPWLRLTATEHVSAPSGSLGLRRCASLGHRMIIPTASSPMVVLINSCE